MCSADRRAALTVVGSADRYISMKGCEKMLELDQVKYEMPDVRNNLKELGESL